MGAGLLLAVRIKGHVGMDEAVRETLRFLRLRRVHTAVLLPDTPSVKGMLRKVERYVTWGKPSRRTIIAYLKRAGLTDESLDQLGIKSLEEMAARLESESSLLSKLNINGVRLGPPKGGYKRSVKRSYRYKGEYGPRDEAIDLLMGRMF
ncbi:MAG: uL30 family ribosomal protein [Nitrososphaerota archaeon]